MATGSKGIIGTVVFDPHVHVHSWLLDRLPGWRSVALGEVVGRDVLESQRLIVPDWRLFAEMGHVHELLVQHRGRTIVVAGFLKEPLRTDGLAVLRRFAGQVVVLDMASASEPWTRRLQVPVTQVEPRSFGAAMAALASGPADDLDEVDVHLREACDYVQANEDEGAFQAAARALTKAPDQPGIVADVARLLARMGRSEQGEKLCRSFLVQRPDSEPVKRTLADLWPAGS